MVVDIMATAAGHKIRAIAKEADAYRKRAGNAINWYKQVRLLHWRREFARPGERDTIIPLWDTETVNNSVCFTVVVNCH